MALDKADDEENRRRTILKYVEDFPRNPALPLNVVIRGQYKDIYCVRINLRSRCLCRKRLNNFPFLIRCRLQRFSVKLFALKAGIRDR